MRQVRFKATTQGFVVNAADTSKPTPEGPLYQYYNDAVSTFRAIQHYICTNPTEFTVQFAGVELEYSIPGF